MRSKTAYSSRVYEQVLGTQLDKRTFRPAHRPAQRYRVKRRFGRELALSGRMLA